MKFSQIIGQDGTKTLLSSMMESERIPHAQLFLGAKGSGGLALAMAFAQLVLCDNPKDGEACGRCVSCIKTRKMIHPDVHYSYPTVGSKIVATNFLKEWRSAVEENPYMSLNQWLQKIGADNKQGNINKDECLAIVKKLSLKTFEGKYKILIMWLPEFLGKEGNRLLKLIEEPPENTLFILVAENQELILNTILSRCQIVKINPLQDEEVAQGLVERMKLSEDEAMKIARLANGNFNEAMSLVDNTENDNAKLFLEWFRACYKGNGKELVTLTEQLAKLGRENQKYFLTYSLHFLRELMVLRVTGNSDNVRLQPTEKQTAINMSKVIGFEKVEKISDLFNDAVFHVERNANPKILFLDTSIKLHKVLRR
ncbi:MAG: DNA polymerase-3 subunit delta' [Saprospiraceae bacterium]